MSNIRAFRHYSPKLGIFTFTSGGDSRFHSADLTITPIHEDGRQKAGDVMSENRGRAIRCEGVQESHDGETLVVRNLNLDIARGESVTMLRAYRPGSIA